MYSCLNSHQVTETVKVLLRLLVSLKGVAGTYSVGTNKTREEGHIMTVSRRSPVGTVVDTILSLYETEG